MKKIIASFSIVGLIVLNQSCTDLDTEVYSQLLPEDYYKTDTQISSAVSAAYTPLYSYWASNELQDLPTDQSTVPVRSNGGWNDGGTWPRLMQHDFRPSEFVGDEWNAWSGGISTCNRLIEVLADYVPSDNSVFPELKTLRAFYFWMLLDEFGNIPVETRFADADPSPAQSTPAEVFAFIENELVTSIDNLPEEKTYGKVNKWVGYTLLAKLYLNAERYGAGAQWQKAADAAAKVINEGPYTLEQSYFTNFRIDNEGSNENIFVVPYDGSNATGFSIRMEALHQSANQTFDFASQPWGGYSVQAEFYNAFEENDKRRGMFITGQQYTPSAAPQWSDESGFFYGSPRDEYKLTNCDEDYNNLTDAEKIGEDCNVFINVEYTLKETGKYKYKDGARYAKYEYDQNNSTNDLSNDFAIFRFADVLLMRAEGLWRLSNASVEALTLVNQIRARAGVEPLTVLTEDDLYWEIKKELALENQARPTTIRFGHFEDTWFLKTDNDPNHRLYPIPQGQLQSNTNLRQNPGY